MFLDGMEKLPRISPTQKSGLEVRERNMIFAATGNEYQLDQLEQALKIQFPDEEVRYHDDRTEKTRQIPGRCHR